jgi:DNA repair protein RadC
VIYEIVSERKSKKIVKANDPGKIFKAVKRYAKSMQEMFILVTVSGIYEVISISIVSIGLVDKTIVHPREVYNRAIREMAKAIIVCHNHPSGNCEPSKKDIELTHDLKAAGDIIGIPLIDHIIFTKTEYISLKKLGLVDFSMSSTFISYSQ